MLPLLWQSKSRLVSLSVTFKPITLNVIKQSVMMLRVMAPHLSRQVLECSINYSTAGVVVNIILIVTFKPITLNVVLRSVIVLPLCSQDKQ